MRFQDDKKLLAAKESKLVTSSNIKATCMAREWLAHHAMQNLNGFLAFVNISHRGSLELVVLEIRN